MDNETREAFNNTFRKLDDIAADNRKFDVRVTQLEDHQNAAMWLVRITVGGAIVAIVSAIVAWSRAPFTK